MRIACGVVAALMALGMLAGCRSAVIAGPADEDTQTIVTVEERPATRPSDKGLIVRDRR